MASSPPPPPPPRRNPPRRGRPTPAPARSRLLDDDAAAAAPASPAAAANGAAALSSSTSEERLNLRILPLPAPERERSCSPAGGRARAKEQPSPPRMGDSSIEVTEESRDASQEAVGQAMEAMSEGKLEEAIEHLTKAILLNPTSAIIYDTGAPRLKPSARVGTKATGVRWEKSGRYSAHVKYEDEQIAVGTFDTIEEAVEAREEMVLKLRLKRKKQVKELEIMSEKQHHQISGKLKEKEEACTALEQKEKELLDEELKAKAKNFSDPRKKNIDEESRMSAKIPVEREIPESTSSLWRIKEQEVVFELEQRVSYLEKELISVKDAAAANEQCLRAKLSTVMKLAELDKESFGECLKKVRELEGVTKKLKEKLWEETLAKRKFHNTIQDLTGKIRVFCRCRPLSEVETLSGYECVVDFDGANDGVVGILNGGTRKTFKFDRVYTPKHNQAEVYADASPLVTSVLDGYNVCIFAYGQTGTGKTFTMEGTESNRGVNYKTLEELFKIAEERKDTIRYNISVNVLEVYNKQIRDLLATGPTSKKLEIKQAGDGSHYVPGIVEASVEDISEVWNVLQIGRNSRAVGSTNVNEHSSRSHCMIRIMVRAKNLINGECTRSKLWLVDLAGSERLAKTDAQGDRLKEAQHINSSLSALGDVISALASRREHIPYRDSKLTHLLQDSLGGDSKALMFVHISPSDSDVSETLTSLNFASRVSGVELGPAKKHLDTAKLQKAKQMQSHHCEELNGKEPCAAPKIAKIPARTSSCFKRATGASAAAAQVTRRQQQAASSSKMGCSLNVNIFSPLANRSSACRLLY